MEPFMLVLEKLERITYCMGGIEMTKTNSPLKKFLPFMRISSFSINFKVTPTFDLISLKSLMLPNITKLPHKVENIPNPHVDLCLKSFHVILIPFSFL